MTTQRKYTITGNLAGKQITGDLRRTGEGETNAETLAPLAAGVAAALTTRTDNDTGVVTLPAGHAQTNGTYDVFWAGGIRRGMTGTITVNALALDLGAGDNLPVATTPVVVCKQTVLDFDTAAATVILAMVGQTRRASVQFQQNDGTPVLSLDLGRYDETTREAWAWASATDVATPFGADVSKIAVSNGSSAGTNTITVAVLRS